MVRNMTGVNAEGAEKRIRAADLAEPTLDSNRFVELFDVAGDSVTAFGAGHGPQNRQLASGWSDIDISSTPDGGSTYNAPTGELRWEVYADPEKEDLVATSSTFQVADLRAAVNASRTDKRLMPALQPLAGDDSHLVLAFRADNQYDGEVVSASNSSEDLGLPFTKYK